ncbi:hypothetical protein SKAU_G00083700 [Synaphobranchus kaupii]|uniref:Uncharacterized protein n=1 Tax=Synaphobranchus kaupii TaxID=118154 RepID=A0A9Q1J4Q8_SYNKA|nr:hypothetical protein SKAU_G00083700 [Synaphobranchus kaupii]
MSSKQNGHEVHREPLRRHFRDIKNNILHRFGSFPRPEMEAAKSAALTPNAPVPLPCHSSSPGKRLHAICPFPSPIIANLFDGQLANDGAGKGTCSSWLSPAHPKSRQWGGSSAIRAPSGATAYADASFEQPRKSTPGFKAKQATCQFAAVRRQVDRAGWLAGWLGEKTGGVEDLQD